ncbi:glycosyl hydrolase family 28 protein [Pedobacter sp. SL55]|uniref:glycosyl hydrolase family 28 protein n=1 Tax=Pedobacter sp. SL55 TaxID=2995161 RepID=UPI00226D6D45|nr:glycosyl hydrolase family 28 protein [Pedobacter sp. SL55]WAC39564.1 glycosyl hydrolase family 28 protein [Pedobacter sp. SL55]
MYIPRKVLFTICLFLQIIAALTVVAQKPNETYLSPNNYKTGTQSERIQKAINDAKITTGKVVIPRYDAITKTNVWLIDQAILLPADFELELNNCKIKLSDKCRDNFIRSANAGLGIKNIAPLKNIKVIGIGNVLLEGANNPRSTGDHNKTLSLNPDGFGQSFGTDAGKPNENQKGGWRNHAIIFAYVDGFQVSGITLKDYHGHGLVMERSTNGVVKDITFDVRQAVNVAGVEKQILNQDGMGVRFGCKNIIIANIKGKSGDDFINIGLTDTGVEAGKENVNVVSGSIYAGEKDNIANIYLQNWQDFYSLSHRAIRIMPVGKLRISNVFIENMIISPLSKKGLEAEYAQNINGLFVRNLVSNFQVKVKGIANASFRDIFYTGQGAPIDIEQSESVVVDHVKNVKP